MPNTDRPKVGPASPEVVRQKLKENDASVKKYNAAAPYQPKPAKPVAKKQRQLRRGPKGKTIMETVDEAVKGATGASSEY